MDVITSARTGLFPTSAAGHGLGRWPLSSMRFQDLVRSGYQEIVLTGVNVGDYVDGDKHHRGPRPRGGHDSWRHALTHLVY